MELLRRIGSMKKEPKEAMAAYINRASMLKIEMKPMGINTPEKEIVAALFSGLPAAYTCTVELLENHYPWDLPWVTRRLLAAELKRRRQEQAEDEAVALSAAAS